MEKLFASMLKLLFTKNCVIYHANKSLLCWLRIRRVDDSGCKWWKWMEAYEVWNMRYEINICDFYFSENIETQRTGAISLVIGWYNSKWNFSTQERMLHLGLENTEKVVRVKDLGAKQANISYWRIQVRMEHFNPCLSGPIFYSTQRFHGGLWPLDVTIMPFLEMCSFLKECALCNNKHCDV